MTTDPTREPQPGADLRRLTQRALLLRLVVAVLLHFAVEEASLAPDQETYHYWGGALADYWFGNRPTPPVFVTKSDPPAYPYIVGGLYLLLGTWSLLPKLLNSFVGARTVPLVYDVSLRITGSREVSLRAATYTAYFPSLVLWSALNLRDVWIVFLILFVCSRALALQDDMRLRSIGVVAAALYLLTLFRHYIFFVVAMPILLSFAVRGRRNFGRNLAVGSLIAMAVIYTDVAAGIKRAARLPDLQTLQEYRYFTGFGGSRTDVSADVSTPLKALSFLPRGISIFLLAPYPWQVANWKQALTVPEMLFFYTLVPRILSGVVRLVRERLSDSLLILLIAGGLTLGYALGQANIGTAYRYRAQVLPFYLIFAAVGVEASRRGPLRQEEPAAVEAHA